MIILASFLQGQALTVELSMAIAIGTLIASAGVGVGIAKVGIKILDQRTQSLVIAIQEVTKLLQAVHDDMIVIKIEMFGAHNNGGIQKEIQRHRQLLHWLATCITQIAFRVPGVELPKRPELD